MSTARTRTITAYEQSPTKGRWWLVVLMILGWSLGGIMGPLIISALIGGAKNYTLGSTVIAVIAVIALVSILLTLITKIPRDPRARQDVSKDLVIIDFVSKDLVIIDFVSKDHVTKELVTAGSATSHQ